MLHYTLQQQQLARTTIPCRHSDTASYHVWHLLSPKNSVLNQRRPYSRLLSMPEQHSDAQLQQQQQELGGAVQRRRRNRSRSIQQQIKNVEQTPQDVLAEQQGDAARPNSATAAVTNVHTAQQQQQQKKKKKKGEKQDASSRRQQSASRAAMSPTRKVDTPTTAEQQTLDPVTHSLHPQYRRILNSCHSWQQLAQQLQLQQQVEGLQLHQLAAAAAAATRLVRLQARAVEQQQHLKQQHQRGRHQIEAGPVILLFGASSGSSGSNRLYASQSGRSAHTRQQQQQDEAAQLWQWLHSDLLAPALQLQLQQTSSQPPSRSHSRSNPGQGSAALDTFTPARSAPKLDTVTAASLLHATAAMGWHRGNVAALTGLGNTAVQQFNSSCEAVAQQGLAAAVTPQPGSGSGSSNAVPVLCCPAAAVINLAAAADALGVRLSMEKQQLLLYPALTAALSGGSSSSGSSSSSSRLLGYPLAVKLLQCWVLPGAGIPNALLESLAACVQEHICHRPHLLLPLLARLKQLDKQQQQQQSKYARAGAPPQLRQNPGQELLLRFREELFTGLPAHVKKALSRQIGTMLTLQQQGPERNVGWGAKDLLEITAAVTQLPPSLAGSITVKHILPAGAFLLQQAVRQLQDSKHRTGSSNGSSSSSSNRSLRDAAYLSAFTPVEISIWLSTVSKLLHAQRQQGLVTLDVKRRLAAQLLDHTGEVRGVKGVWLPSAFVPLITAAQDLGLAGAAGPEFWVAAHETVLLELNSYWPAQLVRVLQCMAAGQYKPDPGGMELYWLPAITGWFVQGSESNVADRSSSSSSKYVRGRRTGVAPLTVPQLIDLLVVLAKLSHKPQNAAWWDKYQATLQQQCFGLQQQQQRDSRQQPQQQPPLTVQQISQVIWATGKLRLHLGQQILIWLLQMLQEQQQQLQDLPVKQCIDIFVGLAKLLPKTPGAMNPELYQALCEVLLTKRLMATDVTNLIRCMGSIADGTSEGAISGALVAANRSSSSSSSSNSSDMTQQQQQQQGLVPPERVLNYLLSAVQPGLGHLKGRALSMLIWGIRKIGYTPSQDWLQRYQAVVVSAVPQMADYEVAIIFSCLVHTGCPVDTFLLQQLFSREPRTSFSLGIMADLQSALQLLEQQQVLQLGAEGVELQLRLGTNGTGQQQQQQQQQQGRFSDGSSSSSSSGGWYDPWYDAQQTPQQQQQQQLQEHVSLQDDADSASVTVSIDSLIDQARSEIGANSLWQQQPGEDQLASSAASAAAAADDDGIVGGLTEGVDAATAQRIRRRIDMVQELFRDAEAR